MRKFQITSEKLNCEITFTYSVGGKLTGFNVNVELTFDQLKEVIARCYYRVEDLLEAYKRQTVAHLFTEILPDLSYEAFLQAYKYRLDKKRGEDVWNKLSDKDKANAILYISEYEKERNISGAAKLYAKTYLGNKIWR